MIQLLHVEHPLGQLELFDHLERLRLLLLKPPLLDMEQFNVADALTVHDLKLLVVFQLEGQLLLNLLSHLWAGEMKRMVGLYKPLAHLLLVVLLLFKTRT